MVPVIGCCRRFAIVSTTQALQYCLITEMCTFSMNCKLERRTAATPMVLYYIVCLLLNDQSATSFLVTVEDDISLVMALEPSDLRGSAYIVKITGESKNYFLEFENTNSTILPPPLVFNASYHGLYYIITLMVMNANVMTKPAQSVTILTKPLPVTSVLIHDYKLSPEKGVIFELKYPEKFNVFTRVNISYLEDKEPRSMLYKDFFRGKTVFKHWLPGTCYSNITFQLVSEATVNRSTLVRYSGVGHKPKQHRTVPNPPTNISHQIVHITAGTFLGEAEAGSSQGEEEASTLQPYDLTEHMNESYSWVDYNYNGSDTQPSPTPIPTQPSWPSAGPPAGPPSSGESEEFENEDQNELGSAAVSPPATTTPFPAVLLQLQWLPPLPPTSYDGFNIYIYRNGNSTDVVSVDEHTRDFSAELKEPGTYTVSITTVSSSGVCDARESTSDTSFTFYLSPEREWFEALQERPQDVSVMLLSSTSASLSWSPSQEAHSGILVSVRSLTCHKPKPSQRMESHYCTQVNSSRSSSIENLTPGAQYQVVVYHKNGPLVGPPSEPVIFGIEPTGIRDLVLYPLEPTALILSWSRPYHVTFRKYVVEMFYFNPATLTSEWSTYYEIAGTVSLTASVRVTNLLPAWYYNFRVTMVTWGEPELSCCDSSTVSFITAPEAPEISSVEYSNRLLNIGWKYGEGDTDLAHSRMLHWLVVAEGRKRVKKSISSDVSRSVMRAVLSLPPGDIYNLTVTACTERSKNTSQPRIIKLEPAPPKSLFAVNKSQTSVTLLWVEEGVVDFYRVFCKQVELDGELKQLSVNSHMVTVSSLLPSTAYNCSVTSFSHSIPSEPAYIRVSTLVPEMNPNVLVISALAVLSILLLGLLLLLLLVLRKKHLQMGRECGAGTFVNFASLERGGKLPYNWRRSIFAFLTLLPSCLWTDYLLAFYINPWSKTALKKRKLTNPVQLDDFDTYMKDMNRDSGYKFSLQFEDLKHVGLDLPHEAADLPVNRAKNRYTNILPYDFSRVKLISMHNDEGSDYINANYIPGYRSPQEYIATQGPLPETRNDFWKMVLQQKCHMVVMLTQCSERRRVKCDHYWPFTEEPVAYGDVTVEMTSEKEVTEWAIRNFRLSYADEIQDVLHLNYTSWPDHGVPTVNAAESILQFVQIVRQQAVRRKGPVLVHCSAGVGRTGTFIALDRLLQHIREHDFVDILGLVSEMRSHRLSMVQTEEQYVFIHQCVQLMWRKRKQLHSAGEIIYENTSKP
ncbi:receptor-type tyrosine-protein phosphatase O-like isoform X1 [Acipenser ruthenus]|uniref:receptor-type tyrosine-protein phosphatase O-like isoform X1 n=1 Tax=Acipenser ruthenus TaxID=7906 RepID=UPI001560764D|nr:receptor-type tyrosine-protein phosphatase O-like isoform X1 [Acipenser ruthenus]